MAGNTISIRIRAQNDASSDLRDIRIDIDGIRDSADRAEGGTRRLGGAFGVLGGAAAAATAGIAALTAGVGVMARGALEAGGNFEAAMMEFAAVKELDITSEAFKAASDAAKEMGSTTQFSATEAANALGFLGRAGFSTEDAVSSLPGVLSLAAAAGMDLASTADIASNVLSGFGMGVDELTKLNDVLAKTAANANVDVRMLGESFKYVGPVARGAGLSVEQTAAAIGKLGDAGIQGSEAGTALRMGLLQLQAPSDGAQKVLDRLGVTVRDSQGNFRDFNDILSDFNAAGAQVTDWVDIVGTEAATGFQILTDTADPLRDLTGVLYEAEGAAARMQATMEQGFKPAVAGLGSAFEGLQIAIFEAGLGDIATDLVNELADSIRALSGNEVFLDNITRGFEAIASVIPPMVNNVASALSMFGAIFSDVANNSSTATSMIEGRMGTFAQTTASVLSTVNANLKVAGDFWGSVWATMSTDTLTYTDTMGAQQQAWIQRTAEVLSNIQTTFQNANNYIGSVWASMSSDTTMYTDDMNQAQRIWVDATVQTLRDFQGFFQDAANGIERVWSFFADIFSGQHSTRVIQSTETLGSRLTTWLQNLGQEFMAWVTGPFQGFGTQWAQTTQEIGQRIETFVQNLGPRIVAALNAIIPDMAAIGANLMDTFRNSISSRASAAVDEIRQIASNVSQGFRDVLGIRSPSRVFEGYGFDMIEGAIVGIRANAAAAIGEVEGLANQIEAVLQRSLQTTRDYVSAVTMGVQAGLQSASDAIPLLQAQADELRGRLQGLANEDGTFIGLSENQLQVAQTASQQLQVVTGQLSTYQSQLEQSEQAAARAAAAEQQRAQAAMDARYEFQRASGQINDQQHLTNLQQQAEAIRRTNGETAEYYQTLTQAQRVQDQITQQSQRAASDRHQQSVEYFRERAQQQKAEQEAAARAAEEEARAAEEAQRAAEELNRTMMQQAENIYSSQVLDGAIALEDQIARVKSQVDSAKRGTNEWLAAYRQLTQLESERDGNLFELQFLEEDVSTLDELRLRLERTQSELEQLQNQRGSSAYLQAAQRELDLQQAINAEVERERELRNRNAVERERVSRRIQARAETERIDDDAEQYAYTAQMIMRSEGAFANLTDALVKTRAAGVALTDGFLDYLTSSRFADVANGNIVGLTDALYDLGQVSREDTRSALEQQRDSLAELLPQLEEGSEAWYAYAAALGSVIDRLRDMANADRAAEVDAIMNPIGMRQVELGAATGQIDPVAERDFYRARASQLDAARGNAQSFDEYEMFTSAMLDAQEQVERLNALLDITTPLELFRDNLFTLAGDTVPYLNEVLAGFATSGPLGGLVAFFSELMAESEGLAGLGEMVTTFVTPLIELFDQLFSAAQPLVAAVLDLAVAFQPLLEIVTKILTPVLRILGVIVGGVADAMLAVVNAFVAVYNRLLGWLFGRIEPVSRTNYETTDDTEPDSNSDTSSASSSGRNETDFGNVPPTVQLAVATPLVEAADTMLEAARLMLEAFASGSIGGAAAMMDSGSSLASTLMRHSAAMDRHSASMDRASTYLDRLVTEGISVEARADVRTNNSGSATLALR